MWARAVVGGGGLKWVISSDKIELFRRRSGVLFDTDAVDVHSKLQNYPVTLTESIIDVGESNNIIIIITLTS